MRYPFRFRVQEWLAKHSKPAQYPRQQFIPKNPIIHKESDWLDKLGKLLIFGFTMCLIWGAVIAVAAFFLIANLG